MCASKSAANYRIIGLCPANSSSNGTRICFVVAPDSLSLWPRRATPPFHPNPRQSTTTPHPPHRIVYDATLHILCSHTQSMRANKRTSERRRTHRCGTDMISARFVARIDWRVTSIEADGCCQYPPAKQTTTSNATGWHEGGL